MSRGESESEGEWSPWGEGEEEEAGRPLIAPSLAPAQPQSQTCGGPDDSLAASLVSSRPAHTPQYFTALSATMGALAMGTVLGYSSPAGAKLMSNSTGDTLHLTKDQNSLFSSTMNIGALLGGPLGGLCLNAIGRRGTMLASVFPFITGWLMIVCAESFMMLVVGRVLTGLCVGVTSLAVPTYIGEYSSPDIRGTLGSGFQLMVTVGVLYTYSLGAVVSSWRWLAALCILPLLLYLVLMFFAKESPCYLLTKGREGQASAALQYFRGKKFHIQTELDMMRESVEEGKQNKAKLSDLCRPYILKPLLISFCLMFFQQFSGVNGVLFNLTTIFADSGSSISDDVCSIIVAVVLVVATLLATMLMDKAGRKLLLIISSSVMALSLIPLGGFFYLKQEDESWAQETLGWLPLVSLIVFISAFSLGYGPIPWLMMGELFSPHVKELAASQATMLNWTLSFVVTVIFVPLQNSIGNHGVYWLFSGLCVVNLVFCVAVVPETKGRTLDEITAHFGGPPPAPTRRRELPPVAANEQNSLDC